MRMPDMGSAVTITDPCLLRGVSRRGRVAAREQINVLHIMYIYIYIYTQINKCVACDSLHDSLHDSPVLEHEAQVRGVHDVVKVELSLQKHRVWVCR